MKSKSTAYTLLLLFGIVLILLSDLTEISKFVADYNSSNQPLFAKDENFNNLETPLNKTKQEKPKSHHLIKNKEDSKAKNCLFENELTDLANEINNYSSFDKS